MADETTLTTAADYSYSAIIEETILAALYANNNATPFVRRKSLVGQPSKAADFPKWAAQSAAAVAEATALTNTAISSSKATLTAGENGIQATITDLLDLSDIADLVDYAAQLGFAVAEKFTTDVFALSSGFSNSVGSTTVNLAELVVLNAVTTLTAAKVPGPYVGSLHPQQWEDYVVSVGSSITPAGAQGTGVQAVTNLLAPKADATLGTFHNVTWYQNPVVPTANAGADRGGMVISASRALGWADKRGIMVEFDRDISLRATKVVAHMIYGVGEIDDTSGVEVISDA